MTIDIDEAKVERNMAGLWLSWTLATAVGLLLGFLAATPIVDAVQLNLARIIVPLLAGILVGLSQWIVLRAYLTASSDWILAGGTAWALGFALGLLLIQSLPATVLGGTLGYILFGGVVGLVQWPVLRREIPNLLVWILANALGWTAGFLASQLALSLIFRSPMISPAASTAVLFGVSGLVAGAITGAALVWIVRQPERN
jgi:hypothetical protein